MEARLSLCIAVFTLLLNPVRIEAQDLGNLVEIAHYPLINSSKDALGHLDSIRLLHAPYDGPNGVYSNGIYVGHDPDNGTLVQSPQIEALYDSVFAVQLQFRLTDLDGMLRPIIVLGLSYRYIGFEVQSDNTFAMLYNNFDHIPVAGITATEGVFYTLTFIHHALTPVTEFYLNGEWIGEVEGALDRPEDDGVILNVHPGMGRTHKGNWRNLKIFGSDEVSALEEWNRQTHLHLYPNPARDFIVVNTKGCEIAYWSISDATGKLIRRGQMYGTELRLSTNDFPCGLYLIYFSDDKDKLVCIEKFLKME